MTVTMTLDDRDRVLVFAPHPDDETLAAGAVIQAAVAAGAALRVVFATDGDNNPWPQRWIERRWRIGHADRARWGQRRRAEALAALQALGVDTGQSTGPVRFLGWPDQGLTDLLMGDGHATAVLAAEIASFAPTRIVVPVLGDAHPDHSALRVMADLALLRSGRSAQTLGFLVHGEGDAEARMRSIAESPDRVAQRQRAMLAHATQLALSRRRLLALAARAGRFESREAKPAAQEAWPESLHLPCPAARERLRRPHDVLVVIATRDADLRFRGRLPRWSEREGFDLVGTDGSVLRARRVDAGIAIGIAHLATAPVAAYAKLHRSGARLVVFDRARWHGTPDLLTRATPVLQRRTAPGLT